MISACERAQVRRSAAADPGQWRGPGASPRRGSQSNRQHGEVDSIGGETQARSWGIIKGGGALASLVGDRWTGTPEASIRKTAVFGALAAPQLGQITRLIDDGLVKPVISQILPLSEARKAHEMIEGRHTHGKIILRVI